MKNFSCPSTALAKFVEANVMKNPVSCVPSGLHFLQILIRTSYRSLYNSGAAERVAQFHYRTEDSSTIMHKRLSIFCQLLSTVTIHLVTQLRHLRARKGSPVSHNPWDTLLVDRTQVTQPINLAKTLAQ